MPEGLVRGCRGQGRLWTGRGLTPVEEAVALLLACWMALARMQLFTQSLRTPTLGQVTSRYKADGSRGQREQPFSILGVCVA